MYIYIENLINSDDTNIFESISTGALNTVGNVGAILANLIAFTSFFAFLDSAFAWFFSQINLVNGSSVNPQQNSKHLFWIHTIDLGSRNQ